MENYMKLMLLNSNLYLLIMDIMLILICAIGT
jgi:hypothetical protein